MNKLKCPKGTGDIYANLLRQIAIRGYATWRIAGFMVGEKSLMLGLGGSNYFDSLVLWSGKLAVKEEPDMSDFCVETFYESDGGSGKYESTHFTITNLPSGISSFSACLLRASGSRSVEENASVIKENMGSVENYVPISSRHSDVVSIAFEVEKTNDSDLVTFIKGELDASKALEHLKETVSTLTMKES